MHLVVQILVGVVAAFHVYVMWLEMFAWTTRGPKVFKNFDKELFPKTKALAANQGLYNGFLAAGLIWTYFICNPEWQFHARLFFLGCVIVAGIYGAFTADKKIFFVQALPAIITVVLMHFVPWKCHMHCSNQLEERVTMYKYCYDGLGNLRDFEELTKQVKVDPKWEVITTKGFEYNQVFHRLTFYKKPEPVAVDGGMLAVAMDSLGVIFMESETWRDYFLVQTNNDSINNLINLALGRMVNSSSVVLFLKEFKNGELNELLSHAEELSQPTEKKEMRF